MTLAELIEALGGKLVQGSPEFVVQGVNSSALAGLSDLVFAEDAAAATEALGSNAGAVVLRAGSAESFPQHKRVIDASQPRLWFARAAKLLNPAPSATGVHPAAILGEGVSLAESVTIGPGANLGDYVHIGAGTRVEAGAVVGQGVRIGEIGRAHV